MENHEHNDLLELIQKTAEFDRQASTSEDDGDELTFERDEDGILWSYDKTGKKVGRIYEHGDE